MGSSNYRSVYFFDKWP